MVIDAFLACLFNVHYLIFLSIVHEYAYFYEYIWKSVYSYVFFKRNTEIRMKGYAMLEIRHKIYTACIEYWILSSCKRSPRA